MKELIRYCKNPEEIDQLIIQILIQEFQKPGLILLPTGKTFESQIYPRVNQFFSKNLSKINNDLKISHLDELVDEHQSRFSSALQKELGFIINQIGSRFFPINIKQPETFNEFIKINEGPRLIFLGLGSDPENAHIAFIGEEYINSETSIVRLSSSMEKEFNCTHGLTIGTNIFENPNLEEIIVVVKGKSKSKSLKSALEDEETGLGYLIKNYSKKLVIYADEAAIK